MKKGSLIPIRWLITPFAALAAFVASQELFSLLVGVIKPTLFPSLLFWTASDWCATSFAILTAVEIAPAKKTKVAIVFAIFLTIWHSILLFIAPHHPIAAAYSYETIVATALGGFIIAGLLVLRVQHNEQMDIPGDELVQVMLQQLAESRAMLEAENRIESNDVSFPEPVEDSLPVRSIERDLLLLERELRYLNLERTAYISAIRFAIAVERDASYINCRGEFLLFHQIVLDSAMRLSVMPSSESFWKPTAHQYRNYESMTDGERKELLAKTELLLPIEREMAVATTNESAAEIQLEAALVV